ncbi:MAG TPA: ABC transporter ATP-binding protein [Planctomycetota bacterium]|jgi:branched-chain amino acid transport system ATP-binding protein
MSAAASGPVLTAKALSPIMLEAASLNVYYGGIHAVKNVSLQVRRGELTAIIGANGAGKSTTLKTIIGLMRPVSGTITFEGQNITGRAPHENVSHGLVLCPEGRRIFPDMTVSENLALGAYSRTDPAGVKDDIARMQSMFPILRERAPQLAGTLSGGEQQMLAIARALMSRPKLLMLDEPSLGLAPLLVSRIFGVLKELKQQHVTILLVEQNARQALEIADRAYVLETGDIAKEGPARDLISDEHVVKAYLGA